MTSPFTTPSTTSPLPAASFSDQAHHPVEARIASIADRALLVYLPHSEAHSLWRFDLDGLTGRGFRVQGRDGSYDLDLCALDGHETRLARFLDKQEALQCLQLIHSALQRAETGAPETPSLATCPLPISRAAHETINAHGTGWRPCCRRMFRWVTFWRVLFLTGLAALLFLLLRPQGLALPGGPAVVAPVQAPSGVPLDADQILSD